MNKILMWILIVLGICGIIFGGIFVYEINNYGVGAIDKKPAVYLYPQEDSVIEVKVNIVGKMIEDIPTYDNGWEVFVTKEGLIENKYDYLFYEAKLKKVDIPNEGWVVEYEKLGSWFEFHLTKLGLNEKEKTQFKEYWLEELPESNYYEIKLLSNEFLKENMDLIISPKPDSMLRLNFYFKSLDDEIKLKEPKINGFERNGFTVVEWGGILEN